MNCIAAFLAIWSIVLTQGASAAEMKSILVFVDSLSDGFMLKRSEAYPALLEKKVHDTALNFTGWYSSKRRWAKNSRRKRLARARTNRARGGGRPERKRGTSPMSLDHTVHLA